LIVKRLEMAKLSSKSLNYVWELGENIFGIEK